MQDNQNALQNAGQHGYSYYLAVGNHSSTLIVVILAFILLVALLKSEARYRQLVERMCPAPDGR